jgi:SHAQKYF class myb-like DNA-binding protein
MSSLPPVADPTAPMAPPPFTSTAPVVSGIVVATPSSTITTAPTTIVTTTVAPPPPAITVVRTAPVLTTVPVLSAQAPVHVPVHVPVTAPLTTSSTVVKQLPVVATTLVPTISKSSSSSKGSKKKAASAAAAAAAAATVTMATAATAQSSGANGGSLGENTGRWTSEEHNLFLQGLELHGKGWKKIAGLIKSRTVVQIRTHAQKYFQKLAKAKQNGEGVGGSNAGVGNAISMMMMEGRSNGGGSIQVSNGHNGNNIPSSSTSGSVYGSVHTNKRRKQTTGTKRKAIQSVVASARREGNKKLATTASTQYDYPVGVAPALAPYILPFDVTSSNNTHQSGTVGSGTQSQVNIPLEDSLYVICFSSFSGYLWFGFISIR